MPKFVSPLVGKLPFSINDPERDVFIWWSSAEVKKDSLVVTRFLNDLVGWSFGFVDEIRVKNIELRR
jgi:hypothetical protein